MRILLLSILAGSLPLLAEAESLTLLPAKFTLDGPAAEQRLVLELADGKTLLGQVTNAVTFTSSNPKVVRIQDGLAVAVGNGTATVTGKSGRNSAKAEVRVVNMDKPGVPQQLLVRATFSNGESRDVPRYAKFTSANNAVCVVSDDGLVTVMGRGKGAISAWFLSRLALATAGKVTSFGQ